MDMKFSIIIPVRSINDFLKENIFHLKQLTYSNFEVTIVTDVLEGFEFGDNRFNELESGKIGPGAKRNLGAKKATGDVFAFLDDDAYPTPKWLNEAYEIFKDENIYALGGPAVTPEDVSFREKCSGAILKSTLASAGTAYRHTPSAERKVKDYPSVNLFVRKGAFEKVGGYNESFWPGEDTKLCLDLINAYNRPFQYSPKPVVFHHRRNVFKPHLKQISRYGKHRGQFARIFPETSRRLSFFIPSLFVVGLLTGPVLFIFSPLLWYLYFFTVGVYMVLLLIESTKISKENKILKMGFYAGVGIFLTHLVYGLNFIHGFLIKPKLQLRPIDKTTGKYLGG